MARTKRNAMNIAEAREKIRTTQLINRLTNHALGKNNMTATQVKATEVLLRKTLPDLTAVEGKLEHDVTTHVVSGEPMSAEDWQRKYANGHAADGDLGAPARPAESLN